MNYYPVIWGSTKWAQSQPVIRRVMTPLIGVIAPVTHLHGPFIGVIYNSMCKDRRGTLWCVFFGWVGAAWDG